MSVCSPTVSLIMAVWNAERTLSTALDSVRAQTFTDWELICVNDASTDGSLGILQQYAQSDARIKVLSVPHGGCNAALNAGLDAAHGRFLGFIDNDDAMHPQALELAVEAMKDFDIVAWDYDSVPDSHFNEKTFAPIDGTMAASRISDYFTFGLDGRHVSYWCKLYRREVLDGRRFEDGITYNDMCLFWLTVTILGLRAGIFPVSLYRYRERNGSIIHSPWTEKRASDMVRTIRIIHGYAAADATLRYRLQKELFPAMVWSSYKISRREPDLRRSVREELAELFADGIVFWRDIPLVRRVKMFLGLWGISRKP